MKVFSFLLILLVTSSDCFGKNQIKVTFCIFVTWLKELIMKMFDAFRLENEITNHFRISSSILVTQGYGFSFSFLALQWSMW